MCSNCNNDVNSGKLALCALAAVLLFILFAVCSGGIAHGAEVKAVPLAQINQAESPVIAKAMGIGKPEAHDIPKFDIPPAAVGIGIAAMGLFILQLASVAVTVVVVVIVGVWTFRKFFGAASVVKGLPPILAALDNLVASHRAKNALDRAVHSRLAKIGIVTPLAAPKKSTRKKKANVAEKSS